MTKGVLKDSGLYVFASYFIVVYLLFCTTFTVKAIIDQDVALLLNILIQAIPSGLLTWLIYWFAKGITVGKRFKNLSDDLNIIAREFRAKPMDGLSKLDEVLSENRIQKKSGAVSPAFLAVYRFLEQILRLLIEPRLSAAIKKRKRIDKAQSLNEKLADQIEVLAEQIKRQDEIAIFDALASIYVVVIIASKATQTTPIKKSKTNTKQSQQQRPRRYRESSRYSDHDFIEDNKEIVGLLQIKSFWKAVEKHKDILKSLHNQDNNLLDSSKWQALIGLWLTFRLKHLQSSLPIKASKIWIGPSSMLAFHLERALIGLSEENPKEISEVITESFDWRFKIPRALMPETRRPKAGI